MQCRTNRQGVELRLEMLNCRAAIFKAQKKRFKALALLTALKVLVYAIKELKSSVQQKLMWVKNSTNRWLLAFDFGARHYFVVLFYLHLGFTIFSGQYCPIYRGVLQKIGVAVRATFHQ
jgi:hypothetical protein